MNFKVISYYTPKYALEVERLKASILRLGLDAAILPVDSEGSWQKNTCMKPDIIADCLRIFNKPILFVDADAEFLKYPSLIVNLCGSDEEMAYHLYNPERRNEVLSGTLFFKPTENSFMLIKRWKEAIGRNPEKWEQQCLQDALKITDMNYYPLPIEYCCIFDCPARERVDPVIIHHQASRRLRT